MLRNFIIIHNQRSITTNNNIRKSILINRYYNNVSNYYNNKQKATTIFLSLSRQQQQQQRQKTTRYLSCSSSSSSSCYQQQQQQSLRAENSNINNNTFDFSIHQYRSYATVVQEKHASTTGVIVDDDQTSSLSSSSSSLLNNNNNHLKGEENEIIITNIPNEFWINLEKTSTWNTDSTLWNVQKSRDIVQQYDTYLKQLIIKKEQQGHNSLTNDEIRLLQSDNVIKVYKILLKCKFNNPIDLAIIVRQWEKYIGQIGYTDLTDHLSIRLLTANAKAGNLGRCLSLLDLRKQKHYTPRRREFTNVIRAVRIATLISSAKHSPKKYRNNKNYPISFYDRSRKNIYIPDRDQPTLDNPTRWLDAILIHMKERNYPLTISIVNKMLHCYAGAGYTGKATHHFYKVLRQPINNNNNNDQGGNDDNNSKISNNGHNRRPREWIYTPEQNTHVKQDVQVKLHFNRHPPPFYKVPAQVKGKLLHRQHNHDNNNSIGKFRYEYEIENNYSITLSAAFAFADSIQHGACGHDPIILNIHSYNALIRACIYRGAIWRAMYILDTIIPNSKDINNNYIQPNSISYNWILTGLARIGDINTAQEYYFKMINNNNNIEPDSWTVRVIVDGLLNLGDTSGAVTVVQDFFNQHCILPPVTTHCKILEFCLARGMIYEAKRYLYFIQQLWHWKPNEKYHTEKFIRLMNNVQQNQPQIQKPALEKLFAYFGETLIESDFL